MKELIAQATLCKNKIELTNFLEEQSANKTLSKSIRSQFEKLLTRENVGFKPFRTRVINLLQMEEQSALTDFPVQDDSNDDNPNQPNTRKVDHETALKEINETIAVYIRNALDQIAQHKEDPKKNNKEANIIALVHGLNELLDNPEHKKYINLNARLFSDVVKLQNALNEIGLGEVYKPIHYLFNLQHKAVFWLAMRDNQKELVVQLLKAAKGKDELLETLFAPNQFDETPLHLAADKGHKEIAVVLVEAAKGNPELLKILFAPNHNGWTALHLAADKGHEEIAVALIEASKENPDLLKTLFAPDNDGFTPLHLAARYGNKEIAVALVEAAKRNPEFLKALFVSSNSGWTALHFAARNGHKEIAVALIEAAKGNSELLKILFAPNNVCTALHLAAHKGHKETAVALIEASRGNPELLKILFAPNNGWTALHLAARNGHKETAVALVKAVNGNDGLLKTLFAPDGNGFTPQQLAKSNGYKELAKILEKLDPVYKSSTCRSVLDELQPGAGLDGQRVLLCVLKPKGTKPHLSKVAAVSTAATSTNGAQVSVPPSVARQVTRSSASRIVNTRG